jgi:hypothetical protein
MRSGTGRRLTTLLIVLGVAGGVYIADRPPRPCARPIPYALGTIDPRFRIGGDRVINDARVATAIWGQAAGKPLFVYDSSAALRINLIYDDRAENAALGQALDEQAAAQDSARAALYAMRDRYMDGRGTYAADLTAINARGGATPDERQSMEIRRQALQALSDSVNQLVDAFNHRNTTLSAGVDRFNQEAGKTITAGRFVRDTAGARIEVYKFVDDGELIRFLAHEFGHAVGLDHNGDTSSIMYALDERGHGSPSRADLASLHKLCGE